MTIHFTSQAARNNNTIASINFQEFRVMTGFGSPCGACKFLRRKCMKGCVFAPYFCHDQGAAQFAAVHKVFGASNASKLLMHVPDDARSEAAVTISYEAQARLRDPVYGCVAHIFALQQQIVTLQAQLASLKAQASTNEFLVPGTQQDNIYENKFMGYQQGEGQVPHPAESCTSVKNESQHYFGSDILNCTLCSPLSFITNISTHLIVPHP